MGFISTLLSDYDFINITTPRSQTHSVYTQIYNDDMQIVRYKRRASVFSHHFNITSTISWCVSSPSSARLNSSAHSFEWQVWAGAGHMLLVPVTHLGSRQPLRKYIYQEEHKMMMISSSGIITVACLLKAHFLFTFKASSLEHFLSQRGALNWLNTVVYF